MAPRGEKIMFLQYINRLKSLSRIRIPAFLFYPYQPRLPAHAGFSWHFR